MPRIGVFWFYQGTVLAAQWGKDLHYSTSQGELFDDDW